MLKSNKKQINKILTFLSCIFFSISLLFFFNLNVFSVPNSSRILTFLDAKNKKAIFQLYLNDRLQQIDIFKPVNKYLDYDSYYDESIIISMYNKDGVLKKTSTLFGYDTGLSYAVRNFRETKYEAGDYLKISLLTKNVGMLVNPHKGLFTRLSPAINQTRFVIHNNLFHEVLEDPPQILGATDVEIELGEKFDAMKNVRGFSNFRGDITNDIKYSGYVDEKKLGTYYINYTLFDMHQMENATQRKITVIPSRKVILRKKEAFEFKANTYFKCFKEKDNYFKIKF